MPDFKQFKVGDVVRVIDSVYSKLLTGEDYRVTGVQTYLSAAQDITVDGGDEWWASDRFELAPATAGPDTSADPAARQGVDEQSAGFEGEVLLASQLDGSHLGRRITLALGAAPVTLVTAPLRTIRHLQGIVQVTLAGAARVPNPVLEAIGMKESKAYSIRGSVPVHLEPADVSTALAATLTTATDDAE